MTKSKVTKPYALTNLNWLNNINKLWLSPQYQREEVWTLSQKQLLVDSLFNEIDIPKVYFRVIDHDGYAYEVVDGQQRLRAIFEYLADSYTMLSDADPVDGHPVAGLEFSKLVVDLQMKFQNQTLDIVELRDYSDDDIEEIFLRLQNGTPLNAAEKRRAIAGSMRTVVEKLAQHDIFKLAGFNDKRFAFEDSAAKVLHLLLHGDITDIKVASIKRTYTNNQTIVSTNKEVVRLRKACNFIYRAFKDGQSPKLKKYSMITLPYLVVEMLDTYDLSNHADDFAEAFLDFEKSRTINSELPEDQQDPKLAAYANAARSDSIQDMRYRHNILHEYFVDRISTLVVKDPNRSFTDEQRMAIFRRDGGQCQIKGPNCEGTCEDSNFHADHKVPHSKGGSTTVDNGQVSCIPCNLWKGAQTSP